MVVDGVMLAFMGEKMNKVVLVDWNIFVHKAIYSWYKRREIPPTYTSLSMVIASLRRVGLSDDDLVILAVDSAKGSWRRDLDQQYKANRKELRERVDIDWSKQYADFDDLLAQIDNSTPWHVIVIDRLEADHIIACTCKFHQDRPIVVISSDSDYEQLWAYPNVQLFSPLIKIKGGKGGYKLRKKDPYHILIRKIEKETADNLVSPVLSESEYETRKKIVSLLELPSEVEEAVGGRLRTLGRLQENGGKSYNLDLFPFAYLRDKFPAIYEGDKVVTYEDSVKKDERKKKKAKKLKEKK